MMIISVCCYSIMASAPEPYPPSPSADPPPEQTNDNAEEIKPLLSPSPLNPDVEDDTNH
ncbi:MAG: hypothetical protein SVR94_15220 [Pseudomonadota bacterium]|nr:hypothetical protein [Pseudomonadota bacterium]